jgi:hypothetical protein
MVNKKYKILLKNDFLNQFPALFFTNGGGKKT